MREQWPLVVFEAANRMGRRNLTLRRHMARHY